MCPNNTVHPVICVKHLSLQMGKLRPRTGMGTPLSQHQWLSHCSSPLPGLSLCLYNRHLLLLSQQRRHQKPASRTLAVRKSDSFHLLQGRQAGGAVTPL